MKEIGFVIKKEYAIAYDKQCKAMKTTMSKRLRELLINDMNDLSVRIDILKRSIEDMQKELSDLESLQTERIKNPVIPDHKKATAIKMIDDELTILDQGRGVWGPRDYLKRLNAVMIKTGLTIAEIMPLYKERSLIVMKNSSKLHFFDQVHNYLMAEGVKNDDTISK